jgi:hypothetical protein
MRIVCPDDLQEYPNGNGMSEFNFNYHIPPVRSISPICHNSKDILFESRYPADYCSHGLSYFLQPIRSCLHSVPLNNEGSTHYPN